MTKEEIFFILWNSQKWENPDKLIDYIDAFPYSAELDAKNLKVEKTIKKIYNGKNNKNSL